MVSAPQQSEPPWRHHDLPRGEVVTDLFFARASDEVAHDLIGKILWRPGWGGGRLAEVEAYLPAEDPASHSACGPTRRNAAMFGPPGTIYVFLSYGVHYLLNFVCDEREIGSAVLIRALDPLAQAGEQAHGGGNAGGPPAAFRGWCGPGRVGKGLGILPQLNGLALGDASGVYILDDGARPEVGTSTRIGISRGDELPLRYYLRGSKCVTRRWRTTGGPCS